MMLDGPVNGNNIRAANGPALNIRPCRAARRAALAAQAQHAIPGRAGPGMMTIGACHAWVGSKTRISCRAVGTRAFWPPILSSNLARHFGYFDN
jgi:hypothetical protein